MATRVNIPPPPWEQKKNSSIPPPPWEEESKSSIPPPPWEESSDKSIPPPPWETAQDNAKSSGFISNLASKASDFVKNATVGDGQNPTQSATDLAKKTLLAPFLAGEKITDVSAKGRELKGKALEDIETMVRTPSESSDTKKALYGAIAESILEFSPMTPEDQMVANAMGYGIGKIGGTVLAPLVKKYPAFFEAIAKERSIITPEAKGNINYIVSELKSKLGIPQERGLTVYDAADALKKGRISQAEAARMDKSIFNNLLNERNKVPEKELPEIVSRENIILSEPEKRIYFQQPETGDVFYNGVKIKKDVFPEASPKIQEINKIDNDIRMLRDLESSSSIPDKLKAKLPEKINSAKKELITFIDDNLGDIDFSVMSEINKSSPEELLKTSQRVSTEFIKSVADPVQPKEPGVIAPTRNAPQNTTPSETGEIGATPTEVKPFSQPQEKGGQQVAGLGNQVPGQEIVPNVEPQTKPQRLENVLRKHFDSTLSKELSTLNKKFDQELNTLKEGYRNKIESAKVIISKSEEKRLQGQIGQKNFNLYKEELRKQESDRIISEYKSEISDLQKRREGALMKAKEKHGKLVSGIQARIDKAYPRPGGIPDASSGQLKLPNIEGSGKIKERGLSANVEAKAISKGLVEGFGDLPEYKTVNMEDQAIKAQEIMAQDYEQAKRIAMGQERAPKGVIPESLFVAVEKKAIADGDVATLRDLATASRLTAEATAMGQRIRTLGERNADSPVGAMSDIAKIRKEVALKRLGEKGLQAEKQKIAQQVDMEINRLRPKRETWVEFIQSIQC